MPKSSRSSASIIVLAIVGSCTAVVQSLARGDTPATGQDPVQSQLVRTVVIAYAEDGGKGTIAKWGTGFCVHSIESNASFSEFLTDNHVVTAPNSGSGPTSLIVITHSRIRLPAKVVRASPPVDLAVVSVADPSICGSQAFGMSSTMPPDGIDVRPVGFPVDQLIQAGLFGENHMLVSALPELAPQAPPATTITYPSPDSPWVEYRTPNGDAVEEGNSGGPLVDPKTGVVYGILEGFYPPRPPDEELKLHYATTNLALSLQVVVPFLKGEAGTIPSVPLTNVKQTSAASSEAAVFQKSAERGNPYAQNNIGLLYQFGHSVPKDYGKALHYFQLAANQHNSDAITNIGVMYAYGYGVAPSEPIALKYFQRAAELDNVTAENDLGLMYVLRGLLEPENYTKALSYFRLSAKKGNSTGQNALAAMYENGQGVPQDNGTALQYYGRAAAAGSPYGFRRIGCMYENGPEGVSRDLAMAFHYFGRAAMRGDYISDYAIGLMYESGQGVPQDQGIASDYFRRALAAARAEGVASFDIPELHSPPGHNQNDLPCRTAS